MGCKHSTVAARTLTEDLLTFHNTTILNVHRGVPAGACAGGEERKSKEKEPINKSQKDR